jgi:ADP-heptose:LPS heptosyltransferase
MSTAIMPQDSPPVLIIRLDGIGDALALTPLLAALRERAIPVDLILRRENAGIFSRLGARHVEIAPFALRSSTAENLRRIADFAATLAPRGYASVLVATEDPGGYRLARAIGAPSCGFDNGWGKPLKTLWVRSMLTRTLYRPAGLDARGRHECEVLFELGRALLGDAQPTRALEGLRPLLIAAELRRDERVVVQITEKWRHFGVLAHEVAAVLQALARDRTVRAIASAREGAFADAVAAAAGVVVERFDALEAWKEAIGGARALVAPDSGAVHVAGMLGTPTVALFPQRNFDRQVARWHPWAAPYRAVRLDDGWSQRAREALEELLA